MSWPTRPRIRSLGPPEVALASSSGSAVGQVALQDAKLLDTMKSLTTTKLNGLQQQLHCTQHHRAVAKLAHSP